MRHLLEEAFDNLIESMQEDLTEGREDYSVKKNGSGGYDIHHSKHGRIGSFTHDEDGTVKGTMEGGRKFKITDVKPDARRRKVASHMYVYNHLKDVLESRGTPIKYREGNQNTGDGTRGER